MRKPRDELVGNQCCCPDAEAENSLPTAVVFEDFLYLVPRTFTFVPHTYKKNDDRVT